MLLDLRSLLSDACFIHLRGDDFQQIQCVINTRCSKTFHFLSCFLFRFWIFFTTQRSEISFCSNCARPRCLRCLLLRSRRFRLCCLKRCLFFCEQFRVLSFSSEIGFPFFFRGFFFRFTTFGVFVGPCFSFFTLL